MAYSHRIPLASLKCTSEKRRFVGMTEVRMGLTTRFEGIPDVHYGEGGHWVSNNDGVPLGR
jgi:hypothetical protein